MYVKGLMEFLHERGLQCFSGLQVPAGVNWETFVLRLTGENGKREKPKVLIIILTATLYQSKPCLKEIDTAINHEVELLPVRFEDKLPGKAKEWTNLKGQDWEMRKLRVQEKLNSLNNIPNPGTVPARCSTEPQPCKTWWRRSRNIFRHRRALPRERPRRSRRLPPPRV